MSSPDNPFHMLTDAPLSEDWNKENVPVSSSSSALGGLCSPSTPVARPHASQQQSLSSPSNLLKRPLAPVGEYDFCGSGFKIKRRRGLCDRSVSLEDVEDLAKTSSLGASPSLSQSNPTTPRRPAAPSAVTVQHHHQPNQHQHHHHHPTLQRSYSENNAAIIMRSCQLADTHQDLTGDFHQALSLPLLKKNIKHQDLNTIDCHTMAKLVRGEFEETVRKFRIIDARYIYEFEGGHIRGAENFGKWDENIFLEEFLPKNMVAKGNGAKEEEERKQKRDILIFHCEFSSVRGPALMRDLRKKDRCLNKETYPALHYPECYLLHNGYKEFYENYPDLCDPKGYQPMNDPNFSSEEKMFRKKAKSWAAGTVARTGGASSRLLKL